LVTRQLIDEAQNLPVWPRTGIEQMFVVEAGEAALGSKDMAEDFSRTVQDMGLDGDAAVKESEPSPP
jgi:hypothetical protein